MSLFAARRYDLSRDSESGPAMVGQRFFNTRVEAEAFAKAQQALDDADLDLGDPGWRWEVEEEEVQP